MRIWSFVQQKGGSGKSTICTNLAVCAEENGETVLIVDLDPQSSASLWHVERGTNKPNVLDAMPDKLTKIIESAPALGISLCLIDSPSKLDAIALAAIRAADMVICPTLPDLFNLGSLQDTVQLLEAAEKLSATVAVINNVDQAGAAARVGEAKAVIGNLKMLACPVIVHHWPQFQTAAEKGKGVTETGTRTKKAADEIRALWNFLDQHAEGKRARSMVQQPTKSRKASKKAREAAKS